MNLIISGENPQNLAKVEALARQLGLTVNKELETRRRPAGGDSRKARSDQHLEGNFPHLDKSPLYGIE